MAFTKSRHGWTVTNQATCAHAAIPLLVFTAAIATAVLAPGTCFAQSQSEAPKHKITITFDYDFTAAHACSPKITKKCISKFIVYDVSGDKPYKLFTIS